jgi:hypothetical protein
MLPNTSGTLSLYSEATTDHITPYHYVVLKNAVSKLSPTGRKLLQIIDEAPEGMFDWTSDEVSAKLNHLKLYLGEIGWSKRKIAFGINSVKKMLDEI